MKTLFFGMVDPNNGVQRAPKRHRLRTYHDCFYGHELINWLKGSDKAGDDSQAMVIGQALLDAKFVICMTDNSATFHQNDALYQFRELSKTEQRDLQVNIEQASCYEHDEQNWDISGLHGMSMCIDTSAFCIREQSLPFMLGGITLVQSSLPKYKHGVCLSNNNQLYILVVAGMRIHVHKEASPIN